jgi:hypothetical protein
MIVRTIAVPSRAGGVQVYVLDVDHDLATEVRDAFHAGGSEAILSTETVVDEAGARELIEKAAAKQAQAERDESGATGGVTI